ncbi:MAG TPA: BTAD domain-containing putative transcriptional regulator [Hyphomicrobiaceae bacterium]|nr:BTAD domain-containing putative transcriptional regulator [Hyphomicrobiaceae bacterium]
MQDDALALPRVTPHLPARRTSPPARSRHGIRVSLLDGFGLEAGGGKLALSSCKARALIAYLVLTPGMKETRERLIGLLWSETEDGKARASLRQLLHCLREALGKAGVQGIVADKVYVGLNEALFTTDLDELMANVDRGGPEHQLFGDGSFAESFLRGYDDVDPAFGSWLAIKRENVRQALIRKLEAGLNEAVPQSDRARRIAARLLDLDPTHETACQAVMRACVAAGNVGGALSAYKRLWERLDQDYDVEPSRATQDLVVAIKDGTYQAAADAHRPPAAREPAPPPPPAGELDPILLLAVKLAMAWAGVREAAGGGSGLMRPLALAST